MTETLHKYADRIKARAIRRMGELAKKIEPKRGTRGELGRPATRTHAATAAGISPHQLKLAAAAPPEKKPAG
jgi:hypothetical protein